MLPVSGVIRASSPLTAFLDGMGPDEAIAYGLVGLMYFALCFPLSLWSRQLERRLRIAR